MTWSATCRPRKIATLRAGVLAFLADDQAYPAGQPDKVQQYADLCDVVARALTFPFGVDCWSTLLRHCCDGIADPGVWANPTEYAMVRIRLVSCCGSRVVAQNEVGSG